jgi:malonyl-CoA O-methyltransferase
MMSAVMPDFDRRAPHYDEHASVQRGAAAWLAEWLPEEMDGPALEIGAGTGLFTRHVVARAPRLVATDIAPRMVSAGIDALPSANWAVADAADPPGDECYRWVLSCSTIQWLRDPGHAFAQWRRVSAPGARLLAGLFIRGTLAEFLSVCPEASPFVWREADEWLALLADRGWRPLRHEERTFMRRHRDATAMLREFHNVGAVVPRRIGPGRLRRALRECDRIHGTGDGVESTFVFLRLEAVRE